MSASLYSVIFIIIIRKDSVSSFSPAGFVSTLKDIIHEYIEIYALIFIKSCSYEIEMFDLNDHEKKKLKDFKKIGVLHFIICIFSLKGVN